MSTKLGWIISGTTNLESPNSNPVVVNHLSVNTANLVKSFWKLESIPNSSPLTREEKRCELRFEEHHTRDNNGRYSVMLPFKPNRKVLGDCASRGLLPSELVDHELWWFGPKWLMTSDIPFPTDVPNCQEALKEERKQTSCAVGLSVEKLPIISRVSSFRKLQRVLAWCLRFISNAKLTSTERKFGALTTKELEKGLVCCIKQVQVTNFASELKCLQSGKPLPANSRILNLYPFIDNDGSDGKIRVANVKTKHGIFKRGITKLCILPLE
ncbi:integrase catalytic domain-containing protein [Trichonephila clavata]|uniref:Integrase catalytic domain-containing protein n=1 Tax=Trichonephila clavata TaxID=2740835 RepID=A0A8X6KUB4_TRICU|nr:integrase catalytic domain-containing protein [Trichonephila clavata]